MKFRQLEYFIEVVDCGSISTAAKKALYFTTQFEPHYWCTGKRDG